MAFVAAIELSFKYHWDKKKCTWYWKSRWRFPGLQQRSEQAINQIWKDLLSWLFFIPKPKQQRRRKTSYLRSKIWNRHNHKNKASNNVIWRWPSLDMSWNESFVGCQPYVKFMDFWVVKYFHTCLLTSILLRNKVAESNALTMPKRNWMTKQWERARRNQFNFPHWILTG